MIRSTTIIDVSARRVDKDSLRRKRNTQKHDHLCPPQLLRVLQSLMTGRVVGDITLGLFSPTLFYLVPCRLVHLLRDVGPPPANQRRNGTPSLSQHF